tara:strand:+ start:2351 stop:2701 length:351 start_codon:yes stop_codon:yes gene_type:complete
MSSNTTENNAQMINYEQDAVYASAKQVPNEEKIDVIHFLATMFDISREDSLSALLQAKGDVEQACNNLQIKLGRTGPAHEQDSEYLSKILNKTMEDIIKLQNESYVKSRLTHLSHK